jgi:hypothetical protein
MRTTAHEFFPFSAYFCIGPIRPWVAAQSPYHVTETLEISPMDVKGDGKGKIVPVLN